MKFNRKAKIDTGAVRDRRSGGGGFGGFGRGSRPGGYGGGRSGGGWRRRGGSPFPSIGSGGSCAGSIISLVVIIIILVVIWQVGGVDLTSGSGSGSSSSDEDNSQIEEDCETGADAEARVDCRAAIFSDLANEYWSDAVGQYDETDTVLFADGTDTGCGFATSDVGPFYCPADQLVYIDLGFFDAMRSQLGAKGGPFAEAYVIAHEYGHHVQDELGTSDNLSDETGPTSDSVRLELQADCYAGVWAAHAEESRIIVDITNEDIKLALDAASSVGDDRIQESATGRVDPESWTHGSASQRQEWFTRGFRKGNREACNTFAPNAL